MMNTLRTNSRLAPALRALIALSVMLLATSASAETAAKLFARAKDAFARQEYEQAARLCWQYIATTSQDDEKHESAQYFLAASLENLNLYHGAVEYYVQVAGTRRTPRLLPRAVAALERIALERPIDEDLVLRDLIGDSDFGGNLTSGLDDFVSYWQGVTNLRRGLASWASERLERIGREGYYYFAALYVASVRLLHPETENGRRSAVESFARLFGPLDLAAALESLRRRGEADSGLADSLKAMINDDNQIDVRFSQLPKNWEVELAMLGFARVKGETAILIERSRETDEEELGRPFAYQVEIGGIPVYRRAPHFERRAPAIQAVAMRRDAVRKIQGKATHALARLLYERERYAAAYDTLGQVPKGTELGSEILLERAWSKYKAGDPHRAMGLLYALDAPVYRHLFAPEKYVLRGLIYRRFCHFRAAKLAARRFHEQWAAALENLRAGVDLKKIKTIRAAALRRGGCRDLFRLLRTLKQEHTAISNLPATWQEAGLTDNLKLLYSRKIDQVEAKLNKCLDISTRVVAEQMLKTEEQANLLEYEVGQAIFQRVTERSVAALRKRAPRVPVSSSRVYYRFGGEYWTQELPNYKFNIEDRCVD